MTTKTVNYTPEQTSQIVADYLAGMTVEAIATVTTRSVKSIVAKLSREKVYVKKTYTTKTGEAVVKKDDLADKLTAIFGFTESEAESMTKANKTALKKILDKFEE